MEETNKTETNESSGGSDGGGGPNDAPSPAAIVFPASSAGARRSAYRHEHPLFPEPRHPESFHPVSAAPAAPGELMGPILRRKKVVSMPLGAGGDFFVSEDGMGGPHRQALERLQRRDRQLSQDVGSMRQKQLSHESKIVANASAATGDVATTRQRQITPTAPGGAVRNRKKQSSFMENLVRRKQISLDLLGPNDFFAPPTMEVEEAAPLMPTTPEDIAIVPEHEEVVDEEKPVGAVIEGKQLFLPLRFSAPIVSGQRRGGHGGGHGPTPETAHGTSMFVTTTPLPKVDEETAEALKRQSQHSETLKLQLSALKNKIDEDENRDSKMKELLLSVSTRILETQEAIDADQKLVMSKLVTDEEEEGVGATKVSKPMTDEDGPDIKKSPPLDVFQDDGIVRADRCDKIKAAIVFLIMLTFTVVVCTWDTHIADYSHIYAPVGLACVTDCLGDSETRDFFHHHNHFETGELIDLIMHMDPNPEAEDVYAVVEVVGEHSGHVKAVVELGPVNPEIRLSFNEKILVDFDDPDEHHVINVNSTDPEVELSFTLAAEVRKPLANYSVLVAALIMVIVYAFILVEVIHRTLVAIFGSMLALLFLFIMSGGYTESIQQIMLGMEWSTLGLLFGMMLLVGELSHTGIFEWCAVRLLMASRGSFNLLMVLLGVLTAVASAFLDNVTTMLLVAPVTIDMCSILGVDPRPYLIGEVLLSNVGGTATLIGTYFISIITFGVATRSVLWTNFFWLC
jgi:hypothetical protein